LANKTPENVVRWLANPGNLNLVAVEGELVLAVGCVTISGEIVLNYVSPAARFRGVSSALLIAMEDAARMEGNSCCTLDSTITAHGFYRSRGYCDTGAPGQKFGLTTFPMSKTL
jgi:GNAT superfamily N-acetyltransferase